MPVSESPSSDAGETRPVAAILLDGEGTLFQGRFLQQVLLPYARRNLARFLDAHRDEAPLIEALRQLRAIVPGAPPVETLEALMDRDARLAPVKSIQAMLWEQGFACGDMHAPVHPDAASLLRLWHDSGIFLFACSPAGEAMQRLLFRHSGAGDLTSLFSAFFDSRSGHSVIRDAIGSKVGGRVLFVSDAGAQLDAAAGAGLATCQVVHEREGAQASRRHNAASDLREVASLHGLPL